MISQFITDVSRMGLDPNKRCLCCSLQQVLQKVLKNIPVFLILSSRSKVPPPPSGHNVHSCFRVSEDRKILIYVSLIGVRGPCYCCHFSPDCRSLPTHSEVKALCLIIATISTCSDQLCSVWKSLFGSVSVEYLSRDVHVRARRKRLSIGAEERSSTRIQLSVRVVHVTAAEDRSPLNRFQLWVLCIVPPPYPQTPLFDSTHLFRAKFPKSLAINFRQLFRFPVFSLGGRQDLVRWCQLIQFVIYLLCKILPVS
mmetsp:Transcript_69333/g.144582  ORF Transcript_69333/g.144582 Transcript_69333/m.144582 type:complete len:254 (-) Transcript_69333:1826-2587(-)